MVKMWNKSASFMLVLIAGIVFLLHSCKSGNNKTDAQAVKTDSTAQSATPSVAPINLPHADSSLAPVLSKVLDDAFAASRNKDYAKLGALLIYRGPDMKRFGYDVFNAKNVYERNVLRITADVFNKWDRSAETKDYARIFTMQQPDGRDMDVMEVIFASRHGVYRLFFGFLPLKDGDYKIVDVTSNLGPQ